ncbi:MAG: hypothetical protein ACQGVC_23025 [Myxococcota bacterium]
MSHREAPCSYPYRSRNLGPDEWVFGVTSALLAAAIIARLLGV